MCINNIIPYKTMLLQRLITKTLTNFTIIVFISLISSKDLISSQLKKNPPDKS